MKPFRLELSPLTFLQRNAISLGERTAVVHGERRYDYAELQRRCNRLASALKDRGLKKHERVAVLCPNSPALLEAHFGVPLARGVLVPMNTRASEEELALHPRGLRRALPARRRVAVPARRGRRDRGPRDRSSCRTPASPTTPTRSSWPPARPTRSRRPIRSEDEPISINYTSGTTGQSKGAVYTHRGAYLHALGVALETKLSYDSVHLWTLPMFHCNGWCLTWGVTAAGGHPRLPAPGRAGARSGSCSRPRASRTTAARRRSTSASSTTRARTRSSSASRCRPAARRRRRRC